MLGFIIKEKSFLKSQNAAVVIQAHPRCFRRRLKYRAMRLAAIIIQRGYRNCVLSRQTIHSYLQLLKASDLIERNWRKIKKEKEAKCLSSAILIQSWYRKHLARTKFSSQKFAALKTQRIFRSYRLRKSLRQDFLKKNYAVIKILSILRMFLCQRDFQIKQCAALLLQSHYRAKLIGKNADKITY